ncbi:hypothetical protein HELRODRAFT_181266 [Helobdella robusta]|uniref:Uncharacterized protein n=1 Tax=Helobdella robusta TaxID=6412 RepID=T1FGT5_HELRO|nr:hypothetical protein HELRODRAFT_181266 [Helobdella robusta]ESN93157.1 hypothetical protein HELRODRAFT_181266 [Helobdella robusta]
MVDHASTKDQLPTEKNTRQEKNFVQIAQKLEAESNQGQRNDLFTTSNDNSEDDQVACAATNTFMRHLWYMNESKVGLAFFDKEIKADEKVQMIAALGNPASEDKSIDKSIVTQLQSAEKVQMIAALENPAPENNSIDKSHGDRSFLLQVVEHHRHQFPVSKKPVIVKELCKN